ncbi:MAG: hypothetical protein IJB59_14605 [Oscillospiraceae bacterium]|nr:hypothetical protein [Oscillospiraceae bacterium]
MNLIELLIDEVVEDTSSYKDADSILEMLFEVYTQHNGLDNETIRKDFDSLYEAMNGKSLRDMDAVINPVCSLCRNHEKVGFIEGMKLGIRLRKELVAEYKK